MKYSVIFSLLFASLFMAGCRKDDNPKVPDMASVPLPTFTQTAGGALIPGDDPASFAATFDVDVYYKNGLQPKSFDVVVIKNGDKSNPKVIQADITTFPTTINVTGQQLIDLFGANIGLGDAFNIGADVIAQDGTKYPAFPDGGVTYAPGIANLPGIVTELRFAAPCLFDPAAYTAGDYEVVVDEWEDYAPGDIVTVAKIDDTHYSFKYAADNAVPIIMEVNPDNNAITVNAVMYGDYGGLEVTATSVEGPNSMVDPCDVSFSVQLNHVYSGGDLGNYIIKLRKL